MSMPDLAAFAEKYRLAVESDLKVRPTGGTSGLELEWNFYDARFRPVTSGPHGESFIDYLLAHHIPRWLAEQSKPEVFHWMIEWITQPHPSPVLTIYEGWLLEACLLNALAAAGAEVGGRLYTFHGNLLYPVEVGHGSIPGSFSIAKRRYLERCVDLYGSALACAGTHVNISLPETLLGWDYMHLPASERGNGHLDGYKNKVYIEAARLMRAFAALSIAITASTPLRADFSTGEPLVLLTEVDSNRNLTFPNDRNLDVPYLYRSYEDYVRLSYDLVQRGVRFGNNNWTPVRARSSAEPVERIISITSDQLEALLKSGAPRGQRALSIEEMARQIEQENLRARIDLPMSRVELRTDEWGHDLWLDIAHLTLVELLALRFYADADFARAFRYDMEDIARARRNESAAATHGLRAEIEDPFTGKPIAMRSFLGWTLEQVRPLALALDRWKYLEPLVAMHHGAPNTAEIMRQRIRREIGDSAIVPQEVLIMLAEEREAEVRRRVLEIVAEVEAMGEAGERLRQLIEAARAEARRQPVSPRVAFQPAPRPASAVAVTYADKTSEIVDLAQRLIRIPSISGGASERLDEIARAAHFIRDYLEGTGVAVRTFDGSKYPALLAYFPDHLAAPVMLCGHFDVVEPQDEAQFEPRVEGDYLWGRGSADMKTVVATYLVWMKDCMVRPGPKPPINLLLVGNEEVGEGEPIGTPHVLKALQTERNYIPRLLIAGERTGERGSELFGAVCTENRGVVRLRLVAHGEAGHSGTAQARADLSERLLKARARLVDLFARHLTLNAADGWHSSYSFPFISVGQPGLYNITPTRGELGVEVRPIPQDDPAALLEAVHAYARRARLEVSIEVQDAGIACDLQNPYLLALLEAVREVSGAEPTLSKKLPATSARFAPRGQGVVWGQSGIGPHAPDERHYIPSIKGYYEALDAFARRLLG